MNEINVSSVIGKLTNCAGLSVKNDTGKESFKPLKRVVLPEGSHDAVSTGFGLITTTKKEQLYYLVQFIVETFGTILVPVNEEEFPKYSVAGIAYKIVCREPTNGYSKIDSIEKA